MILYLGLDPSRYQHTKPLLHYPVIRTEKIISKEFFQAKAFWPQFTHVIFTSQTSIHYWFEKDVFVNKVAIAIGKATAQQLEKRGIATVIAEKETQEGVIELLEKMDLRESFIFWPRSKKARPILESYLSERKAQHFVLDLYDTIVQKIEPAPNLKDVEEIVFTSPSTVRGFLEIYGSMPKDKKLTAIGPVTQEELAYFFSLRPLHSL